MMRVSDLRDTIRLALAALARSPLRSGLTILGLVIGVGAYVAMTSFGQAAKRAIVAQFSAFGVSVVRVQSLVQDPGAGPRPPRPLLATDVDALRRDVTSARRVAPTVRILLPASARGGGYFAVVGGTTPEYFLMKEWPPRLGGVFQAADMVERGKVCVLGSTPAATLFGGADPLGSTVLLGDALSCRVIGVLASKGRNALGRDIDDIILIPLTTFEAYLGLPHGYTEIEVEAAAPGLLATARSEARAIVRRTHGLAADAPDDFRLASPSEAVATAESVATIITRLLAAVAAVSLLVGGIGIMNIQLVSVAERTREIGIRAAIGASPDQIMAQFLAEAIALSGIGTIVGLVLGIGGAWGVGRAMHWNDAIDLPGVAMATFFGLGTGVLFGYLPARRASRLDPVEALRQE